MYMLSLTCESSIGEAGFYAAESCGETPIMFHKQGKLIRLIAKNTRFVAEESSPMERAVRHSFSDSILGSSTLETAREQGHRPEFHWRLSVPILRPREHERYDRVGGIAQVEESQCRLSQ